MEAGGTKFVCAVGRGPDELVDEIRFPTTTPAETIQRAVDFFAPRVNQLRGVGLGSFGPFDVDPSSHTYGFITTTSKPHWSNVNILGMLQEKINLPFAVNMDVVVAGLGESTWGASKTDSRSLYLTVGTGIGGGLIVEGKPYHGLFNLEMGHIRVPHNLGIDPFPGVCPYHRDCFEGLASGPAIETRFGQRGETLPDDHPYWSVEADYIAYALTNYILTLAPERIIVGGGIMQRDFMFSAVRRKTQKLLNGYVHHNAILHHIDQYIVPPALGHRSGALGAIALAMNATE
ncbi:MAG: ROK family protein [Chloroflexota bacterium]